MRPYILNSFSSFIVACIMAMAPLSISASTSLEQARQNLIAAASAIPPAQQAVNVAQESVDEAQALLINFFNSCTQLCTLGFPPVCTPELLPGFCWDEGTPQARLTTAEASFYQAQEELIIAESNFTIVLADYNEIATTKNVPAMGGIGLLVLGLSMLGLGTVRLRSKSL